MNKECSINYKLKEGEVFVDLIDDEYPSWARMDPSDAKAKGLSIIKCQIHNKPIISLDYHYPFYNDMNKCEDCEK